MPGNALLEKPAIRWAMIAAGFTFIGLLHTGIVITSDLSEGEEIRVWKPLLYELTGAYAVLVLLPFLLRFMRRFSIGRENWAARIPLHIAFSALFGATHTLLMWGSRVLLFALLGWGTYDYGDMTYRFLMEYQKQCITYWAIYAVLAWAQAARRSREREVRAAELQGQLAEARLGALKAQLDPHFLFNTLNTISSLVYEDPRAADGMIATLSDLLRRTVARSGAEEVPLGEELDFLGSYLDILRARFQEGLVAEVEAPPETRGALVPHLILQPLAENAVRFSTSFAGRPARVRVEARREGERLLLAVEDNGPGLPEGGPAEKGVGLSNVERRLETLYGDGGRISFRKAPLGGLRVELEIPFRAVDPGTGHE